MPPRGTKEVALEAYGRNAPLRALIQQIPLAGAMLDNVLLVRRDELAKRRGNEFIAELDRLGCDVTGKDLEDEEYSYAVLATVGAAARASRTEKIHLFAAMLANYRRFVSGSDLEEYEEMLRILDGMSIREYHLLLLLHGTLQDAAPEKAMRPLKLEELTSFGGAPPFWGEFLACAEEQGFSRSEIPDMLQSLIRTGFYLPAAGAIGEYVTYGTISSRFHHFLEAVERHEREHPNPMR